MGLQFLLNQLYQHQPDLQQHQAIIVEYLKAHLDGKASFTVDQHFLDQLNAHIQEVLAQQVSQTTPQEESHPVNTTPVETEIKKPITSTSPVQDSSASDLPAKEQEQSVSADVTSSHESVVVLAKPSRFKWFFWGFLLCLILCIAAFIYQFIRAPSHGLPHLDMQKILESVRVQRVFAPTNS